MKLYKMVEIYLKYDNIHIFGIINTFICINNHVNSCIIGMLSSIHESIFQFEGEQKYEEIFFYFRGVPK